MLSTLFTPVGRHGKKTNVGGAKHHSRHLNIFIILNLEREYSSQRARDLLNATEIVGDRIKVYNLFHGLINFSYKGQIVNILTLWSILLC
jgi:hypothetical protein